MKTFTKKEEQVLLAIFRLAEDAYLIPIREEIRKYTGKTYSVGTIYAPLNRLHVHGYLKTRIKKPAPNTMGKPIKYYSLTHKGRAALYAIKAQTDLMWKDIVLPAGGKEDLT